MAEVKDYITEKNRLMLFNDILRLTSVSVDVYKDDPMATASIKAIVQMVLNLRGIDWERARLERQQMVDRVMRGKQAVDNLELEAHRLEILRIVYDANIKMAEIRDRAVWNLSFHPFDIIEKEDKKFGDVGTSLLEGRNLSDIEEQCSVRCIEDYVAGRER